MINLREENQTYYVKYLSLLFFCFVFHSNINAQFGNNKTFARIDFANTEQIWDGFGVNYVESCQTPDYKNNPQDLGGFMILDEKKKQEIINLIFGENGLRPAIIKMFLDPWHLAEKGGKYNHKWSTQNMRYFVSEGLKKTQSLNDSIQIITTLYGPPPFMTKHNDPANSLLNPDYKKDLAMYMIDWVKFLREEEKFPVKYLSLHNEGTDWLRWPMYEGIENKKQEGRDYNLLWRAEEIADFMAFMRPIMNKEGLSDVGLTPGEPINLFRFNHFGIADEIVRNKDALNSIGLITSHGFGLGNTFGRAYANTDNHGTRIIQKHKPDIHCWITSMSWGKMDTRFAIEIYEHIYSNNVNAVIPWAFIQRYSHWYDKNFHPGLAINVREDGTYTIKKGYYLYKQFTTAGRNGMKVVKTSINRPDVYVAAFEQNNTKHPDAFIVINYGETSRYVTDMIELSFTVNNTNLYYSFPVKDPKLSYKQQKKGQMKGVKFKARSTEAGYIMEFAFPWETLGGKPDTAFNFNISARDGRDMPHGKIGWLGENSDYSGEIILGSEASVDNKTVIIDENSHNININGMDDDNWSKANSYAIKHNQMAGTPPQISGEWKMKYNRDSLYLLVNMQDPTNKLGRVIQFDIENSIYKKFKAYRTDEFDENYKEIGVFTIKNEKIEYLSPNHSVTTFIGIKN